MRLLIALFALVPLLAFGAVRDFPISVAYDCFTTEGDALDTTGDGVCDLLTGIRFYDAATGAFITGGAVTQTEFTIRYNADWGRQCHYATVTMIDPMNPGSILESDVSNIGACFDVVPGKPKAPVLQ